MKERKNPKFTASLIISLSQFSVNASEHCTAFLHHFTESCHEIYTVKRAYNNSSEGAASGRKEFRPIRARHWFYFSFFLSTLLSALAAMFYVHIRYATERHTIRQKQASISSSSRTMPLLISFSQKKSSPGLWRKETRKLSGTFEEKQQNFWKDPKIFKIISKISISASKFSACVFGVFVQHLQKSNMTTFMLFFCRRCSPDSPNISPPPAQPTQNGEKKNKEKYRRSRRKNGKVLMEKKWKKQKYKKKFSKSFHFYGSRIKIYEILEKDKVSKKFTSRRHWVAASPFQFKTFSCDFMRNFPSHLHLVFGSYFMKITRLLKIAEKGTMEIFQRRHGGTKKMKWNCFCWFSFSSPRHRWLTRFDNRNKNDIFSSIILRFWNFHSFQICP